MISTQGWIARPRFPGRWSRWTGSVPTPGLVSSVATAPGNDGGRANGGISRCLWFAAAGIAVWLLASPARADDKDPIDAKLDACLATDEGMTTAGMIGCTQTAIDAWDKRLNETYRKAMAALDPKSRDLLQKAQRGWVMFRAAERAAEAGPWLSSGGSLARVEVMGNELSAVRERATELRLYARAD
jgi:uncharacterized protein YecT (DUF1311 family)